MKTADVPFNVWIMELTTQKLQAVKPITVLDIFDGGTTNFHDEGLFSTIIFGRAGSIERDTRFSYIDLRVEIFHPLMYHELCSLKALYKGIMAGKAYALWDDKEKDFVASDPTSGDTGYYFFLKYWKQIKFKRTGSDIRDDRIKFVDTYRDKAMTSKVLVVPAGIRDLSFDESGRPKEGEVNELYRKLLSISNAVTTTNTGATAILDNSRMSMQNAFNTVYEFFENLIRGKGGFQQERWGSRRVYNGTRNVITAMKTSASKIGAINAPGHNNTVLGLYQTLKGTLPLSKHLILNGYLKSVFNSADGYAMLTNKASLQRERIAVPPKIVDRWTTTAGIEEVINSFENFDIRLKPIMVEDHYLGLVYRGPDDTFRIFGDITELPDTLDKQYVFPLSLCELLYVSGYRRWNKLGIYPTRYPVAGTGSIYPSTPYVVTTTKSELRRELNESWEPLGDDWVAPEYPTFERSAFSETMAVHPSRIGGLTADYDGDMCSANYVYTDNAVEEVWKRLNSAAAYIDPNGGLQASPYYETVNRVLQVMTGD